MLYANLKLFEVCEASCGALLSALDRLDHTGVKIACSSFRRNPYGFRYGIQFLVVTFARLWRTISVAHSTIFGKRFN